MTSDHDVISAFLDDEPFDTSELVSALADPEGRELLIDLLALRHLAQSDTRTFEPMGNRVRPLLRRVATAAAILVALLGGYVIGSRAEAGAASVAPSPNRVVEMQTEWEPVVPGSAQ